MNKQRLRLARRIADIHGFREEQQRQRFADAIRERTVADDEVRRATAARDSVDVARDDALAGGGTARYLLLGDMAADAEHARWVAAGVATAAAGIESAEREAWSLANVRKRSSTDRADGMHKDASLAIESSDAAESMELWLVRHGSPT